MPYIPHTEEDIQEMLKTVGVSSLQDLFDEIPPSLIQGLMEEIPHGLSELALTQLVRKIAANNKQMLSFIGAGAYEHYIPAAVWDIASRGEYMTAYTPYQAEASQGSLQLIFEYQTMMANLLHMDISNASLYDGATALTEAILMAARIKRQIANPKILIPTHVHPFYRQAIQTIVKQQAIQIIDIPYDANTGQVISNLNDYFDDSCIALVIPQPNFFGLLEPVNELTKWAKAHQLLTIAVVNPLSMSILKPPGLWGEQGVDIACGEGQPLGIPLSGGGPYYGFLTCKNAFLRQMPGRIVGKTTDLDGKTGFVLTLQAREQHIRRAKATSNICTNQGLMVTASTIFMSLLGSEGLREMASLSHARTRYLQAQLSTIPGISFPFRSPFFNELVVKLPQSSETICQQLMEANIQPGYSLANQYPELENCLLICATETKTPSEINFFVNALQGIIGENSRVFNF